MLVIVQIWDAQNQELAGRVVFGECRFNRLGGIHGGKKNAPESSGAITFSGTFSGTLVGARSGAGAGAGAGV